MGENLLCINGEKCSHKGFIRDGRQRPRFDMYDISLFIHSLPFVSFFFLLPVAIPYRGLSSRNVAFASCSRKIQILSRVCKNIPRSRRSAFCGFLPFSLIPYLSLSLSLYLSAFPRYWDAHSAGFRQAKMPLSALTVPLGSSPFPKPGMEDSWRARFPPAPRRDQCVMQV